MHKTYINTILSLEPHQYFVFGSNTEGRHGKGSALYAKQYFGAKYGQAKGLQGRSYAIVTKDLTKLLHPSVSKEYIIEQIKEFYDFALHNPTKEYFIVYSGKNNANLNGYSNLEMSQMFNYCGIDKIPPNIVFEENFYNLIKSHLI